MEQWKDIIGFEGLYQISDLGRVLRKARMSSGPAVRPLYERLNNPTTNSKGYKQITLLKEGVRYTKLVHILVAEAFLPNPLGLPYVAHRDDIGTNNVLDNLRWATPVQNWEDRRILGTDVSGERNGQAVLTWDKVRAIRKKRHEGTTLDDLVVIFGVSSSCIQNVVYNKTWKEENGTSSVRPA